MIVMLEFQNREREQKVLQVCLLLEDDCIKKFFLFCLLQGEAQKIERLMEAFANRYCQCNPDQVRKEVKLQNNHQVYYLSKTSQ